MHEPRCEPFDDDKQRFWKPGVHVSMRQKRVMGKPSRRRRPTKSGTFGRPHCVAREAKGRVSRNMNSLVGCGSYPENQADFWLLKINEIACILSYLEPPTC